MSPDDLPATRELVGRPRDAAEPTHAALVQLQSTAAGQELVPAVPSVLAQLRPTQVAALALSASPQLAGTYIRATEDLSLDSGRTSDGSNTGESEGADAIADTAVDSAGALRLLPGGHAYLLSDAVISRGAPTAAELAFTADAANAEVLLAFEFESTLGLIAYFSEFSVPSGEALRLHAEVVDERGVPVVLEAGAHVTADVFADGVASGKLTLRDDGREGDEVASDGVYSARVPDTATGVLGATVEVVGHATGASPTRAAGEAAAEAAADSALEPNAHAGEPLWRTAATTAVRAPRLAYLGSQPAQLDANPGDGDYLRVRVPLSALDPTVTLPHEVAVMAELVVLDDGGAARPVVGIRGLVNVVAGDDGAPVAELPVHRGWLQRDRAARRGATLELRDVSLQRGSDFAVVAHADRVPVAARGAPANQAPPAGATAPLEFDLAEGAAPTLRMQTGHDPRLTDDGRAELPEPIVPEVLLVHGFCGAPGFWPISGVDLEGRRFERFGAPGVSRVPATNREFAEAIARDLATRNVEAVNIIAHSQGGVASLLAASLFETPIFPRVGKCGEGLQLVNAPWGGSVLADLSFARPLTRLLIELIALLSGNDETLCEARPPFGLTTVGAALTRTQLSLAISEVALIYRSRHGRVFERPSGLPWCNFITSILIPGRDDGIVSVRSQTLDTGRDQPLTRRRCHLGLPLFQYGGIEDSPGQNEVLVERAAPSFCGPGEGTTTDGPPPDSGGGGDDPPDCEGGPGDPGCECATINPFPVFDRQLEACALDGSNPAAASCESITPDGPFFADKFCFGLGVTCGLNVDGTDVCKRCGRGPNEQIFGCPCSVIGGETVCGTVEPAGTCFGGQNAMNTMPGWRNPNGLGGICWPTIDPPDYACLEDCASLTSPQSNSAPLVCVQDAQGAPVGRSSPYQNHAAHCASATGCAGPIALCDSQGTLCGEAGDCVSECTQDSDCLDRGYPGFYRCNNSGGGRCVF